MLLQQEEQMIDLTGARDRKKAKEIYDELKTIHSKLTTSIETLAIHAKYVYIMESLSILHNSRSLLEIKMAQYDEVLK